ncbi:MAG: hypothetical protein K6E56_07510 [Lachnospiraceae bacterium]|nr:hypothetical protein [Lachnospiraceae bacterium]
MERTGRRISAYIAGAVLLLTLGAGAGLLFGGGQREFSEEENRTLAARPEFNIGDVVDAEFQSDFESFVSDQFPFRNSFIEINTRLRLLMGQSVINGVRYEGDYLIETLVVAGVDEERVAKSREYLSKAASYFEDSGLKTSVIWIPDKEEAFGVSHPSWDLDTVCDSVLKLNLNLRDFYKTDHHWTSEGAYKAYKEIAMWNDLTDLCELGTEEEVCNDFLGTTHSKTLVAPEADSIIRYNLPYDIDLSVEYPEDYAKDLRNPESLYQYDKLSGKNKYEFFLGGNTSYVTVKNGFSADKSKKLLLFKDSFSNSLIPFLAADYEEILLIDLRYTGSDLAARIAEFEPDEVMFIFNRTSFINETSLYKLTAIYDSDSSEKIVEDSEDDIIPDEDDDIMVDDTDSDDDITVDDEDTDDDILIEDEDSDDDILIEDEDSDDDIFIEDQALA